MALSRGEEAGWIGKIPVRNLWWLIWHASDLGQIQNEQKVDVEDIEDNPDDILNLVAEILSYEVERRLRQNLSFGYQPREAMLGYVRGRINLLYTERHRLLDRGKVACRFEELQINTPRNRYVRAALEKIAYMKNVCEKHALRCKSLASRFRLMGVAGAKPGQEEMLFVNQFSQHDAADRRMVSAAHLVFELAMPVEDRSGMWRLAAPIREEKWMRQLYENAIAGFYKVHLSSREWKIRASKKLYWPEGEGSNGIGEIFPSMEADIILENGNSGQRIVVDTKFNEILTRGRYGKKTLRSGYIYQMYAYLRSQEKEDDSLSLKSEGWLLHPCVDDEVDEWKMIQGHKLRFITVDLAASATDIRKRLLDIIEM